MSAAGEHNFCGMQMFMWFTAVEQAEPYTRLDVTVKLSFCRKVLHLLAGHRGGRKQSSWSASSNSLHVFVQEIIKVVSTKLCVTGSPSEIIFVSRNICSNLPSIVPLGSCCNMCICRMQTHWEENSPVLPSCKEKLKAQVSNYKCNLCVRLEGPLKPVIIVFMLH